MTKSIIFLFLLIACFNLSAIYPVMTGRNHAEIRWKSYETVNFKIIYSQNLDSLAIQAANVVEQCYDSLQVSLDIKFKKKYKIYISDMDDIANGVTTPYDYIAIWVNPSEYKNSFSGRHGWLRKVIAHEMVHALNFEKSKSWANYFFPNPGVDHDLLEGFAQFYSGEEWGFNRGDNYLNKAVLDDQYSYGSLWPDNGGLLYGNGFSKVRNLLSAYPDSLMLKTLNFRGDFGLPDFEEGFKKNYGLAYNEYCEKHRQKMNIYYNWRKGITETEKEIGKEFKPKSYSFIHSLKYNSDKTKLFVLTTKTINDPFKQLIEITLKDSSTNILISGGIGNNFSISPDNQNIVFNRTHFYQNNTVMNDLYLLNIESGSIDALTDGLKAFDPVFISNDEVVYLASSGDRTEIFKFKLGGKPQRIFASPQGLKLHELAVSSDKSKLAMTLFQDAKNYHALAIYDFKSAQLKEVVRDTTILRNPCFLPGNNKVIYARTEIFGNNLFSIDLTNEKNERITNFSGSIIPCDLNSDSTVAAVLSDSRKSSKIQLINFNRKAAENYSTIKPEYTDWIAYKPKHQIVYDYNKTINGSFTGKYYSISDIRPLATLPFPYIHKEKSYTGGIMTVWADPLMYHQLALVAAYNPDEPENPQYSFGYVNRQTPLDLTLLHANLETVQINYAGKTIFQNNTITTGMLGYNYNPGNSVFTNHYFSAGYTWQNKNIINNEDFLPQNNEYIANGELLPPENYQSAIVFADYKWKYLQPYSSNGFNPLHSYGFHVNYGYENSYLQSKYHSHSLRSELFYLYPIGSKFGMMERMTLYLFTGFRMIEGKIPAQNQLGLDRYSTVSLNGLIPMVFDDTNLYFVRGNRKFHSGTRLMSSTAELYLPVTNNFGFGFPDLKLAQLGIAAFVDYGTIWQNNYFDNKNLYRVATSGVELKTTFNIINDWIIYGGVAKSMIDKNEKEKYYFGLRSSLPF